MLYRPFVYAEPREVTCPACGRQIRFCDLKENALQPRYAEHRAYNGTPEGQYCPAAGALVEKLSVQKN